MIDNYERPLPTFMNNEPAPDPETKWLKTEYPVASVLGLVLGVVITAGAVSFAWLSTRSTATVFPELPMPVEKPKEVAPPVARPTSSVVGVAKRAAPKAVVPSITLQEIAMADVKRLHEPVGDIYWTKPLVSNPFQTQLIKAGDPVLAEAQQLLGYYFAAKSLPEKSALVLHGDLTLEKMKRFYSVPDNTDPVLDRPLGGMFITANKAQIAQLEFDSASRVGGKVTVYFHRAKGGSLLLDWESFVGYSDMNWQEYAEKRPQTSNWLRAVADAGDYYNYEFADDKHFLCVRLTSPDGNQRMHGYVPRGSALGFMLAKRLNYEEFSVTGRRTSSIKVIVETTFPFNAKSGQCVNIREMRTDRWLMFDWEAK